ncbi:uncharacterized protein EI97DRAFT_440663 [Westerdykella ornata]|uniref:Uncharacterized protein n=1 Tax=Westerdykella ornata TaxID=318751 RepID=A0A6A6JNF6_WESOR|nr:uncharacterized protein EI97DRAFT_440663 [Westerdykella ornata]KAF2278151.1 hypothetical protein EI97DRAFT_440663 [Westerdykella ornata]
MEGAGSQQGWARCYQGHQLETRGAEGEKVDRKKAGGGATSDHAWICVGGHGMVLAWSWCLDVVSLVMGSILLIVSIIRSLDDSREKKADVESSSETRPRQDAEPMEDSSNGASFGPLQRRATGTVAGWEHQRGVLQEGSCRQYSVLARSVPFFSRRWMVHCRSVCDCDSGRGSSGIGKSPAYPPCAWRNLGGLRGCHPGPRPSAGGSDAKGKAGRGRRGQGSGSRGAAQRIWSGAANETEGARYRAQIPRNHAMTLATRPKMATGYDCDWADGAHFWEGCICAATCTCAERCSGQEKGEARCKMAEIMGPGEGRRSIGCGAAWSVQLENST